MSVFRSLMMSKNEDVLYNGVTDNIYGYDLNYKFALGDTFVFSYRLIKDLVALSSSTTFFWFRISSSSMASTSLNIYTESGDIKLYLLGNRITLIGFNAGAGDIVSFVFKVTSKDNTSIRYNLRTRINSNIVDERDGTFKTTNQQILSVGMNPTYVKNVKVTKV